MVDSRPSDAIILSLRANAPLYINNDIIGVPIAEPETEKDSNYLDLDNTSNIYSNTVLMLKKLNQNLEKAIEFEEYEKAAKLRDKINNLKKDVKA